MPDLIVVSSNAMDLDVASGGVFAQHGATAQIARAQLHALDYAGAFAGTGRRSR